MYNDFAALLFNNGSSLNVISKYFEVVGKIRFHTVHTNRKKCKSPEESIHCYEIELSHANINKSHLGN